MKPYYITILFGAIASFLLLDKCSSQDTEAPEITRDTVVLINTHYVKGKPKIVTQWRDTGSIIIDTVQVIQDWSTTYVYADSIRKGNVSIDIIDTIKRSEIIGRGVTYTIPTTIITETRTNVVKSHGIALGGQVWRNNISVNAQYINPKWNASVGYGTQGGVFGAGVMIFPIK